MTTWVSQGTTNKINAHNELGLASAGALDLCRGVALLELLRNRSSRRRWSRRVSRGLAKAGRAALRHSRRHLAHGIHIWRISSGSSCVDRGRASSHLRRRGAVLAGHGARAAHGLALRRLRIAASRVAGRTRALAWVVHREAGGGRRGAWRRRLARMRCLVLRYLGGRRGTGAGGGRWLLDAVDAGDGLAFAQTKALEAGVQRTHMEEEKKDRSREGLIKRCGSGGEQERAMRWGKASGAGRVLLGRED